MSTATSSPWTTLAAARPLPLRFTLHLSRRPNSSLCPCLQLILSPNLTLTRILDPEHRIPYITLSPLFHFAGLTLIQGLLRFNLSPTSFDLSLAGLEPWDDLWISLPLARSIAAQLNLTSILAAILDPKTSLAWSLDEFTQGLAHNWIVPSVDGASYSTDAITAVHFDRVKLLPQGQQVKTLISSELRQRVKREAEERKADKAFQLHQMLVRWSAQAYGVWCDLQLVKRQEEGSEVKRALLEDLGEVVLGPCLTDVLDWSGLIADAEKAEAQSGLLSPLSLTEIAELRGREMSLGQIIRGDDVEETVTHLETILRAKFTLLHRINVLSLPHLASSSDVRQDHPSTTFASSSEPQPTDSAPPASKDDDLTQLHAKLDNLTSKLDTLLSAPSSTRPPQRSISVKPQLGLSITPLRSLSTLPPPLPIMLLSLFIIIVIKCID